ncbi:dynein regulatory complex protein 9-like [Hyposmocoma kahamanoa]|uniref:dynein regulatory complex protein 9-like n=1 Tax=Hyposmocoma kahamanoa TaxID=1477025 RepID=UPI000E6D681B|nr:dynein regulatory complex protein 9-like [Hyposmocoma kahamanoa]
MTRSRHVDNWECARREQHVDAINKIENVYGDSIRYYMNRMKKELIVHHEIEALVNININETLDEIQMWIEKYDKDTETIGLNIQTKRILYLDKLSRRMELEEMIKLHEKEVWDWTEFKRKRAEAQKYFSDMTRCAVMIQAWWRGLLVRKQLGPFKVDKKKKRKKK